MKKIALIILDGLGITSEERGNALLQAKMPYFNELLKRYPNALLKASSQEVGLPWGESGNSEVGHTTLGLGRVVLQDLPQIDKAFNSDLILEKNTIKDAIKLAKQTGKIHIMGLASDGAVHGHISHIINLANIFSDGRVVLHLILDGRDVPEKSAKNYIDMIKSQVNQNVVIGSLSGRYFAMDRDKNYDRTEKTYRAITGEKTTDMGPEEYIKSQYKQNKSDEFIDPVCLSKQDAFRIDEPMIFTNFRADRALQITRAFIDKKFEHFKRLGRAKFFATMTTYEDNLPAKVVFSNLDLNDPVTNPLTNPLAEVLSQNGKRQFHIAETEKFAHVTYFFSGGRKDEYKGQKNMLIPSKKVKSYDEYPVMAAGEISKGIAAAANQDYDFIVANFANPDMVGHSGNLQKTIEALEFLDGCIKNAVMNLLKYNYCIFLTADHGNADEMIDLKSGKPSKEHSINPVPFVWIDKEVSGSSAGLSALVQAEPIGILPDVTTTILAEAKIPIPIEMTGSDLRGSME